MMVHRNMHPSIGGPHLKMWGRKFEQQQCLPLHLTVIRILNICICTDKMGKLNCEIPGSEMPCSPFPPVAMGVDSCGRGDFPRGNSIRTILSASLNSAHIHGMATCIYAAGAHRLIGKYSAVRDHSLHENQSAAIPLKNRQKLDTQQQTSGWSLPCHGSNHISLRWYYPRTQSSCRDPQLQRCSTSVGQYHGQARLCRHLWHRPSSLEGRLPSPRSHHPRP